MSDINVKTNASKLENKKQDKELEELKKAKQDALDKAKQEQIKNKEKQEKIKAEQNSINSEEIINLAASTISKASKSKTKSKGSLFIGIIIGVIIGFLLSNIFGFNNLLNNGNNTNQSETIEETFLTHTDLDFKNVIVGKATEHQELIVMEQPLEVETTITKSGLGNLEIFSKMKNVKYTGKGQYTVNLSKIDNDHIDVDMDNKIVTIKIPHAILQEVILDINNIEFEDTEKGLLAFGDLALTAEQQNEVEVSVKQTMTDTLNNKEFFDSADEFAKLKTWQIFQPLVSSVSNEFVVEMEFE